MKIDCLKPSQPKRILDLLTNGFESPAMYFCRITPDDARELLKNNKQNRKVKDRRVARIAEDISSGRWGLDGNSIALDSAGMIVRNGQHRLYGIIKAGKAVDTFVFIGIRAADLRTIDDVASRSLADNIAMTGAKNAPLIASALRIIIEHESGALYRLSQAPGESLTHSVGTFMLEYEKHPNLGEAATWATRLAIMNKPISIMIYYLCEPALKEKFAAFAESADRGIGLSASDPEFVLRSRLLNRNATGGSLRRDEVMALTVKAWNLYVCERTARFLRWSQVGDRKESFPRPILRASEIL